MRTNAGCLLTKSKRWLTKLTNHSVINRKSQETPSFLTQYCSNIFLPLPSFLLSFSLEDEFISIPVKAEEEKTGMLAGTFVVAENAEQVWNDKVWYSQRKGLALVKTVRLKHRHRNLSLQTELKVLSAPLSARFSPKFSLHQVVSITVTYIKAVRPWRDQTHSSWASGEWKGYKWNIFFRTLKIPTPRKKKLTITHSRYYPCEFKHSKALFLVTHQSIIFPTNLRRNMTEMQMQPIHVTKMPWLAGRASLGDCWVCLEGKLATRISSPLLSIVSSSGLCYFCSIKAR